MEVVREIKEKHAYVARDFEEEMQSLSTSSDKQSTYELPDGKVITIGNEKFRCAEALFNPALIGLRYCKFHTCYEYPPAHSMTVRICNFVHLWYCLSCAKTWEARKSYIIFDRWSGMFLFDTVRLFALNNKAYPLVFQKVLCITEWLCFTRASSVLSVPSKQFCNTTSVFSVCCNKFWADFKNQVEPLLCQTLLISCRVLVSYFYREIWLASSAKLTLGCFVKLALSVTLYLFF